MNKSFTLIELLVTVTIFSIIISIASGFFISASRSQRKILTTQQLLDHGSYVLEYMGRTIRMAQKDVEGKCISSKLNYKKTRQGRGIKFLNYHGECQEFYLEGERLKEEKAGVSNYLTSANLKVVAFNIGSDDSWDQGDDLQPRVTFLLDIQGKGGKPEVQPEIKIQTTISQRNLDIKS